MQSLEGHFCNLTSAFCNPKYRRTLSTYTSAKSTAGRRVSINTIAASTSHPIAPSTAKVIIGARCTPAAQ